MAEGDGHGPADQPRPTDEPGASPEAPAGENLPAEARPTPGPAELLAELRSQGISDERVLAALARVSRPRFVPEASRDQAWANQALPIGCGQTISQPFVVAVMTSALRLRGGERVLEIGTGSGYQAAILAELTGEVISLERHPELAARAAALLAELGYRNVEIHVADGSAGWPQRAPYDAILVAAAGPRLPRALIEQLNPAGGRLVMPVGERDTDQTLLLIERHGQEIRRRRLGPVRFVPLIGRAGWAPPTEPNGYHGAVGS